MTEPIYTYAAIVPMSAEVIADGEALSVAFDRWRAATPQEREQWAREAEVQRGEERRIAASVSLTLDALLDKLDFSREYAEHLVQPYCTCGDSRDGWERCPHAGDLGLEP